MKVKLYTINCPACDVLELKLNAKKVDYEKITDEAEFKRLNIDRFPMLAVNDDLLTFNEANTWVNTL